MKRLKTVATIPTIEAVAEMGMRLSRPHLADYGATRSRHDFTQRQLMVCLILRAYLKTTYRGVLEFLAVSQRLRERLGFADKLPHFTTLQKFSRRSKVVAIVRLMISKLGQAAAKKECRREKSVFRGPRQWIQPGYQVALPASIFAPAVVTGVING